MVVDLHNKYRHYTPITLCTNSVLDARVSVRPCLILLVLLSDNSGSLFMLQAEHMTTRYHINTAYLLMYYFAFVAMGLIIDTDDNNNLSTAQFLHAVKTDHIYHAQYSNYIAATHNITHSPCTSKRTTHLPHYKKKHKAYLCKW